jgi:hypothetical protein
MLLIGIKDGQLMFLIIAARLLASIIVPIVISGKETLGEFQNGAHNLFRHHIIDIFKSIINSYLALRIIQYTV